MATATYIPIATQTLGSAASSITFSSIPNTYTDLRLVLTGLAAAADTPSIQFNGDTATNYSGTDVVGYGSGVNYSSQTSTSYMQLTFYGTTSTTVPIFISADVFSYAGATNKTVLSTVSRDANGSGTVDLLVGLWRSTATITSITIFLAGGTNLSTGFMATLWGI